MSIYKVSQRKMADISDLEQYIDKDYSIHFSDLPRLGINPKSEYDTPLAVCGYPLTSRIYNQLINEELPFAQHKKYMYLYRIKDAFNVDNYNEKKFEEDLKKISELVKNNPEWREKINYDHSLSHIDELLRVFGKTYKKPKPFSIMWNIGRLLCRNTRKWNALLRTLGYNAVVDYGYGILHVSEPEQTMVFNPASIEEVKYYISPEYFSNKQLASGIKKEKHITKLKDPKALEDFARKFIDDPSFVLMAILNNPSANKNEIQKILISNKSEKNSGIRREIAASTDVSLDILKELAADKDIDVKRVVAQRPGLPEEIQEILISDPYSKGYVEVMLCMIDNSSISNKILMKLSNSYFPDLSILARDILKEREKKEENEEIISKESAKSYFKNKNKIIKLCSVVDLFYDLLRDS